MNIHLIYPELPKHFSRPSPVLSQNRRKSQVPFLSLREHHILKDRVHHKQKPNPRSKAILLHLCANQLLFCHRGSMHRGKGSALCSLIILVVLNPCLGTVVAKAGDGGSVLQAGALVPQPTPHTCRLPALGDFLCPHS